MSCTLISLIIHSFLQFPTSNAKSDISREIFGGLFWKLLKGGEMRMLWTAEIKNRDQFPLWITPILSTIVDEFHRIVEKILDLFIVRCDGAVDK